MLRFALIGYGPWGKIWAKVLKNHPQTSLVAVGTSQIIPEGDKSFYTSSDYFSVIRDANVDAVIIASPPQFHAEALKACALARKPVIVEKPYVLHSSEAEEIERIWPQGTSFRINHVNLYYSAYQKIVSETLALKIKEIVSSGGNLGPYRDSYSSLWDYGAHDISMVLHLMKGVMPSDVHHVLEYPPRKKEAGWESNHRIHLQFSSGTTAEIYVGNGLSKKTRTFKVTTDTETWFFDALQEQQLKKNDGFVHVEEKKPMDVLLDSFIQELQSSANTADLSFGRKVIQILEKCALPGVNGV